MRSPLKMLLVEDSPDDECLLIEELRACGFEPEWIRVETESEYRGRLGSHLEVIFSDYRLPSFGPHRALEILKDSGLAIPLIVVSGTMGEEQAVEILKAGATDFVLKDRLSRLGPALRRALRESQERVERQRAEETLRASEARFRQLAANINEVFWLTDPAKLQMIYISPGYETIWGRSCQSLYDSPRQWLESIHEEDRERVRSAALNRQVGGSYDEVYRIVRPDGSVRWIRDRGFPVRDDHGAVYRIAGVAEDITERRELEEQFRQAQKLESIGLLAGGVAHDFNNLLTVISGHASLLLADDLLEDSAKESAAQISNAAQRAASLTRQLLLFSRKQVMQIRTISLNEVVGSMTRMFQRTLGEDISLQVDLTPALPPIHADAGMVEQILLNLVINARDAMPNGGVLHLRTLERVLGPHASGERGESASRRLVCLIVQDSGCGIPASIQARIFEPFFTTKEAGKGTGLGLATVYGIVQQHLGEITIESEVGRGTTFEIRFPAQNEVQAGDGEAPVVREPPRGTGTILVVEDEPLVRGLVSQYLRRLGYFVVEAGSGVAGLEEWRRIDGKIDLLLTDLVMPEGMSGRDLAAAIRSEVPTIPIIFSSGYSSDVAGLDLSLGDGMSFLQKPYQLAKLAAVIRTELDQAAARRAATAGS